MDRSVAGSTEIAGWRPLRPARSGPDTGAVGTLLRAALFLGVAGVLLLPASLLAQQDTIPGDTVRVDTAATARERALDRLRNRPVDPVQPDTTVSDTVASDAVASDTARAALPADVVPPETVPSDTIMDDTVAARIRVAEPRPDSLGPPRVGPRPSVADTASGPDTLLAEDSIRALLESLPGYDVTEYEGEAAVYGRDTGQLELTGSPRVGRGPEGLSADSLLVYESDTGIVCGYGSPVLTGGDQDPVESDELCFNIERNIGVAVGARTQFQQGATWYVRGAENRVYLLTGGEQNALYGERAHFTSCELDHPHYTFKARSLKMVENDMMVARNITLEFADVPVFWLPWMVQSMKRDRRSGLLMPEFGVNDIVRNSTGYNRSISNIGFYWAMNDYASTKATFEWYSDNWTAVEGALTYRWLRQFLQGTLTAKQYWRERSGFTGGGRREFTINTSNSWQPDERTRIQANANYATSTEFVRDNSFDPQELNRKIRSAASVNRSFDWGSLSLGADRNEQLSTGQVDWTLPGLSLNISPVTLYTGGGGSDLTWNGSGNLTNRARHSPDTLAVRDLNSLDATYSHSLSFGRLGLNQSVTWREEALQGPAAAASIPAGFEGSEIDRVAGRVGAPGFSVAESSTARLRWSTSLSYQQVLWSGTVISPNVSINGNQIRSDSTSGDFVAEPNRISAGASLNTSIYGFWPGFGNFSRIRHKVAPTLRWSYSPAPEFSALQEEIFGVRNLQEQNRISLSFNQTFEAKVREGATTDTSDAAGAGAGAGAAAGAADGAATDAAAAGTVGDADAMGAVGAGGASGEPRRLPEAEKVMLLALDTRTSFVYDFVAAADEGRGFLTEEISNSVRSDLLRGFQLSMSHSLFEKGEATPGELEPRRFDPYLTDLSAAFSIDSDFWLFDFLGLTSASDGASGPGEDSRAELDAEEDFDEAGAGAEAGAGGGAGGGAIISGRGPERSARGIGPGGWRASFNYSFRRRRPIPTRRDSGENQLLSGNISFQPTTHWTLRWNTAYSITENEFANHRLTLTRDLHRWQANFDFVKAQNGNFLFSFRVQLRDNPDLKLDYDQREGPSERGFGSPVGAR